MTVARYLELIAQGKCPCGCDLPAMVSRHGVPGFRKGHRPMVTKVCQLPGCDASFTFPWRIDRVDTKYCRKHGPFKQHENKGTLRPRGEDGKLLKPFCGCPEQPPHRVGDFYSKYAKGHAPNHRNAAKVMGSGTPEWRARIVPKMQAYRASLTVYDAADKVAAVLLNHGVTIEKLAVAFGISKRTARQVLFPPPGRTNMLRSHAERYLRFAAEMPYEPSNRQKEQARRADFAWRKKRERMNKEPGVDRRSTHPKGLYTPVSAKEMEATKHLAKKKSSFKFIPKEKP